MPYNKALLLGLGMQGKAALSDLIQSDLVSEILVGDKDIDGDHIQELDSEKVRGVRINASDKEKVSELMDDVDIVIELLPPGFSFPMAELAVENGVNFVSTMYLDDPEETDPEKVESREESLAGLDKKAKKKGLIVLPEFGLDPGLDLILAKQAVRDLDEVDELYCYGAGLPVYEDANNPLKYKFTWSVEGLLKTYKRPARVLQNGNVVDVPGEEIFFEENIHMLDLDELDGVFECHPNGNALRYADKLEIEDLKNMGRYTCRWEGHCDFWRPMVRSGFLEEEPVIVEGDKVSPIRFVAELLKAQDKFWLKEDERDLAMVRIEARGIKDGEKIRKVYQVIDKRDLETGFTAMQRTVGFTASIGAQMILDGSLNQSGLLSPTDIHLSKINGKLEERDLEIKHDVEYRER